MKNVLQNELPGLRDELQDNINAKFHEANNLNISMKDEIKSEVKTASFKTTDTLAEIFDAKMLAASDERYAIKDEIKKALEIGQTKILSKFEECKTEAKGKFKSSFPKQKIVYFFFIRNNTPPGKRTHD